MPRTTLSFNAQSLLQQIIYARNTSQTLSFELERQVYEEEGYLFENAKELAGLLLRIIEGLELNLEFTYRADLESISGLEEKQETTAAHEELRRVDQRVIETIQVAAELTEMLKYIDGAKAIQNPWGVISELDRLCKNLNNRARVIPYPRWEYNYRYYPISYKLWRISGLASRQDSRINTAMTQLLGDSAYYFSLQFPPTSKPNLLQMAMWGHELGHFIDNIEGMTSFKIDNPLNKQLAYISQQHAAKIVKANLPTTQKTSNTALGLTEDDKLAHTLEINESIGELISRWAREVFADLYAVHLFGPAAIFALLEFVRPLTQGKVKTIDSSYPPFEMRLGMILFEYDKWLSSNQQVKKAIEASEPNDVFGVLKAEIERLRPMASDFLNPETLIYNTSLSGAEKYDAELDFYMKGLLAKVVNDFSNYIEDLKRRNPECYLQPEDLEIIIESIKDLEVGIPPSVIPNVYGTPNKTTNLRILPLIINSGWLYWLKMQYRIGETTLASYQQEANPYSQDVFLLEEFKKINDILLKAIDENVAVLWFSENSQFTESDPGERFEINRAILHPTSKESLAAPRPYTGILRKNNILDEMSRGELIIRPMIFPSSQIHETSIDLRLGNEFTVMKRSALTKHDSVLLQKDPSFMDHQSKHFVPFGKPFVLHPWQFISASCLEFIKLPSSCIGWIANRKWWTKLGLVYVGSEDLEPGFHGQILLELTNFGNAPILLYPGSKICSLCMIPVNPQYNYSQSD